MEHIDVLELKNWIDEGKLITLLDIREKHEVDYCKLPDSTHIPMNTIPSRLGELDAQETIVVYCHTGVRSLYVCQYLSDQGFQNVLNLRIDPTVPTY